MIKRYALMESISSNLHHFLKKTGRNLSVPQQKFLRDSLIGLLRTGQPIVSQMARQLPDQQTTFLSRLDRLEYHLGKDSNFDYKVKDAFPLQIDGQSLLSVVVGQLFALHKSAG